MGKSGGTSIKGKVPVLFHLVHYSKKPYTLISPIVIVIKKKKKKAQFLCHCKHFS